jgi:uncharacterized protein
MTSTSRDKLKVIDTDTHFSEPHDLWTSRVPDKYKELVPHVARKPDGRGQWLVNGDDVLSPHAGASSVIRRDGERIAFWDVNIEAGMEIDEVHEGSYNAKARLAMMDHEGVWAHIIYPNTVGFGAAKLMQLPGDLGQRIVEVYNDAVAEMQAESNNRLFPMAVLPFWDIDAAVKEIYRAARDLKLHGITMSSEPHKAPIPLPDLLDRHWDPLWEACTDLQLPVNFHIGSAPFGGDQMVRSVVWPSLDKQKAHVVFCSQIEIAQARVLANLLTGDLLVRFPEINWVSVESGIGWIPYILERLEWQLLDSTEGGKGFDQPSPTELFHRSVYSCFWFEKAAPEKLLDVVGLDNVMFESDFPHTTCYFPGAVAHAEEVLKDWKPEVRRKVLQDTAAKVYHIDL